MRWLDFGAALLISATAIFIYALPYRWSESSSVRGVAGIFVVMVFIVYIDLVDNERHPKVGSLHRIIFGFGCGLVMAFIFSSPLEGYLIGGLTGGVLGYFGMHWAKYVQFLDQ